MDGFDLLRLRPVRTLVHWGGFPYVFQAFFLAVFVALGVFGWTVLGMATRLLGKGIVSLIGVILIVAGLLVSLHEAKRAGPGRPMLPVVVPLIAVGLVFAALVVGWGA